MAIQRAPARRPADSTRRLFPHGRPSVDGLSRIGNDAANHHHRFGGVYGWLLRISTLTAPLPSLSKTWVS